MNDQRYNGWRNYETWNANLWLTNDEGSSRYCAAEAQACYDEAAADQSFTKVENAAFSLRDRLKDLFAQDAEQHLSARAQSSWIADAVNAYITEVNWQEIAEAFIEECRQNEVYEA